MKRYETQENAIFSDTSYYTLIELMHSLCLARCGVR
jgi:hypothetical protein